jgi:large subunit ribosomal protein L4
MADTMQFEAAAYTALGTPREKVSLPQATFDGTVNVPVMQQAVKAMLANQRQGTAYTKTRGLVVGGNQKPWKQKGTGRARAGSNTSPLWPGGGVAFGPKPRNWSIAMNAKARQNALKGALTARARDGNVVVMDAPSFEQPKTKTLATLLGKVGLADKKVLWVFDKAGETLLKSSRNLDRLTTLESHTLNTYALMNCDCLVLSEAGLQRLTERLGA